MNNVLNMKFIHKILIMLAVVFEIQNTPIHGIPSYEKYFCLENNDIVSRFSPGISQGYRVTINKTMSVATQIKVKLDSGSTILLNDDARFSSEKDTINNIFNFIIIKDVGELTFTVKGRFAPNHPPYVLSLKIDGEENCANPDRIYFQNYNEAGVTKLFDQATDKFCGRRRINSRYTELIVGGTATNAGEWPWHTAIMRFDHFSLRYTCGGTLISKYIILTAGHCAAINGVPANPEILKAVLGKYNLFAKDIALQEKDVFQVIVHDDFKHKTLENDIALLKLTTEVIFNNYVQPACLWFEEIYDHLKSYVTNGTVVGWGFDNTDTLSSSLKSATISQKPDVECIQFDAIFYSNVLNGQKFCAGNRDGTSACNGDSGGGFMVFVQDDPNRNYIGSEYIDGAWYVKGIVSVTLARRDASICDPNAYTVFTDVAVYKEWILNHMN